MQWYKYDVGKYEVIIFKSIYLFNIKIGEILISTYESHR